MGLGQGFGGHVRGGGLGQILLRSDPNDPKRPACSMRKSRENPLLSDFLRSAAPGVGEADRGKMQNRDFLCPTFVVSLLVSGNQFP